VVVALILVVVILGAVAAYVDLQYSNEVQAANQMSNTISADNQQVSSLQAAFTSEQAASASEQASFTSEQAASASQQSAVSSLQALIDSLNVQTSSLQSSISAQGSSMASVQSAADAQSSSVAQLQQQASSMSLQVPDSKIMTIHYTLTIFVNIGTVSSTSVAVSLQQTVGLPYHSGQPIQLYLGGNSLGMFNGSMTFTSITSTSPDFNVVSVSPKLPQTFTAGTAPLLTVTVSTPPSSFNGDLDLTVQVTFQT